MTESELAEKIFNEAVENLNNFKNQAGLSPSLISDWTQYIEDQVEMKEREHQDKIREIRDEIQSERKISNYPHYNMGIAVALQILDKYLDDKK